MAGVRLECANKDDCPFMRRGETPQCGYGIALSPEDPDLDRCGQTKDKILFELGKKPGVTYTRATAGNYSAVFYTTTLSEPKYGDWTTWKMVLRVLNGERIEI